MRAFRNTQQLFTIFKLNNGFTASEILNKNLSLKGVMEPYSEKGNLTQLKVLGSKIFLLYISFYVFKDFFVLNKILRDRYFETIICCNNRARMSSKDCQESFFFAFERNYYIH